MAEIIKSKTLNTILRLKYDTLANWKAAEEYVPMKGEVCIVSVPANTQQVASEPAILFKVGDGTGVVFKKEGSSKTELPWASGLAADVYAWAKNPTKPDYNATEISVVDAEGKFTGVTDKTVEEVLKALKTEIDAMGGDAGSISTQINNAINGLGSVTVTDGNYVTGVKVENGKLVLTETPLPDYSNTYAAKSLEGTVATLRTEFDAHTEAVSGYDARITAAQTKANDAYALAEGKTTMAEVEAKGYAIESEVDTALAGKQNTIVWKNNDYDAENNKAVTANDLSAAVAGLSGAMHFEGVKDSIPEDNTGYESGDVILVGNKEYVFDGTTWHELGDESIYAVKGSIKNADIADDAAITQSKIAGLSDRLSGIDAAIEAAKSNANGYTDNAIATEVENRNTAISEAVAALDSSVTATATVDNTVNVLTGVTQVDGKLTGKNEVTLAAIAKTGNVNDLVQTEGDVLVLFGGNAAGWTE